MTTMGCCGKNRPVPQVESNSPAPVMHLPRVSSAQYFEYVGKTGLTVIGPVTGQRYRFARPGMLLAIDERDSPSMVGIPNMRRVKAPE